LGAGGAGAVRRGVIGQVGERARLLRQGGPRLHCCSVAVCEGIRFERPSFRPVYVVSVRDGDSLPPGKAPRLVGSVLVFAVDHPDTQGLEAGRAGSRASALPCTGHHIYVPLDFEKATCAMRSRGGSRLVAPQLYSGFRGYWLSRARCRRGHPSGRCRRCSWVGDRDGLRPRTSPFMNEFRAGVFLASQATGCNVWRSHGTRFCLAV